MSVSIFEFAFLLGRSRTYWFMCACIDQEDLGGLVAVWIKWEKTVGRREDVCLA